MALRESLERRRNRNSGKGLGQDSLEIALPGFLLGNNGGHFVCFSLGGLVIHDVDVLVCLDDSSPQTKLHLGFGSAIELLVDGGIVRVEGNVGAGRVGEAVKLDFGTGRYGKENAKLDEG